jgi:hypothetical protein
MSAVLNLDDLKAVNDTYGADMPASRVGGARPVCGACRADQGAGTGAGACIGRQSRSI